MPRPSITRPALPVSPIVPRVAKDQTSVWAQYTIRLAAGRRDALAAALKAQGIPTAIYYAKPLHRQAAYSGFPIAEGGLPVSEKLADEVISLPMHAYLDRATQDRIIACGRAGVAGIRAPLIPAKAGIQSNARRYCGTPWVPAFAGTSDRW